MKLWQKKHGLDPAIERFTVGRDYLIDNYLVKHDVQASKAHAKMLAKIGILKSSEYKRLSKQLDIFQKLHSQGKIKITLHDEDCHTAIENYLTSKLGNLGKKIHTGRSRNDQSLAAIRLYMREELIEAEALVVDLILSLKIIIKKQGNVQFPGYTHMQRAMPSSIGLWLGAFVESLDDDLVFIRMARKLANQSPLGSAAGYGSPIPLDREFVARELGFEKVQNNTLYVQNSRGKFELLALQALEHVMLDLNKLATDMLLFSMAEFGFISLPAEMTTGSSIMPQKRNPDVLELVRAQHGVLLGHILQMQTILQSLPSGYNRDFQLTKESLVMGINCSKETISIMSRTVCGISVNKKKCTDAMSPELFATHKAYEYVKKGMAFRDAYRKVSEELNSHRKK